ncbi:hypothetical protein E4O05_00895 [Treponema sp. OMZ 787]|uniref:GIY-YIG nuclease family protein n=1 Tax=Treponema sp. OMZ 787 TaxID=2563669 RepID=UPI0020A5D295|nr:hypothetical protein [Treponema sp. OMZ 787]UTC62504.1 hypothetical protein E4O05_00895 [Treponema sp. OMZ 787]
MIVKAIELRNKENLQKIKKMPGYYKWWAKRTELDIILNELNVNFDDVKSSIETKLDMFCIYVGIAAKESIGERLNWHVNDKHTTTSVKYGTLSTLRQSIASIVAHDQYNKKATDDFIDKLYVEYFFNDHRIKSGDAKNELTCIERQLLQEYLRVLNIMENNHPCAKEIKKELKRLRKISKNTAIA